MWLPPPPAKPAPSRSGKFPGLTTLEILSLHAAPLPPASAPSILICAMLLPGTCLVFPLSCPQEDLPTGIRSLGLFPVWEDSHLTSFLGSFHWKTLNLTAKLWTSQPNSEPQCFRTSPSPLSLQAAPAHLWPLDVFPGMTWGISCSAFPNPGHVSVFPNVLLETFILSGREWPSVATEERKTPQNSLSSSE